MHGVLESPYTRRVVTPKNQLFYGDNLEVLRNRVGTESVDLVYLDPPFNSNRAYNVIFARHDTVENDERAQIQAFDDTWRWTPTTDTQYAAYVSGQLPERVADALTAFRTLLGENDAMAYLVNMAPRLVELHRVLKDTGSLYLHCDPTMSHYLKILLDAIFDARNFKSEVIWQRTKAHNSARRWGPVHDVILMYSKSDTFTWNRTFQEYDPSYVTDKFTRQDDRGFYQDVSLTGPGVRAGESGQPWRSANPGAGGRHWALPALMTDFYESLTGRKLLGLTVQEKLDAIDEAGLIHWPARAEGQPRFKQYLEISPGAPVQDVITDIDAINSQAAERLGYPTQKPVALLERILAASSNPGDVVLDPFCGCGTTVDAAQKLDRQWIGIDVTYIAVDLIQKRLLHTYGAGIGSTFDVLGIPRDRAAALALFSRSPFEFERWAVSLVNGKPNQKQVGDKGIDGVARFPLDRRGGFGRVLVSVKGGRQLNPSMVRDLGGTVSTQQAEMGVLILNGEPTRGMVDEANHAGTYTHPHFDQPFPRIQIITINDLLLGRQPRVPPTVSPYMQANRATADDAAALF